MVKNNNRPTTWYKLLGSLCKRLFDLGEQLKQA